MSKSVSPAPPDGAIRESVVHERSRNVVIDAGAGSGKTTILVARFIDLVAPCKAGVTPLRANRVAAITFTRKAAGELRYRIRQALIGEIGAEPREARRADLQNALSELDAAYVGTIHSFSERLLRMRPMEAGLSPKYSIVEETGPLAGEVFERLVRAVQAGCLKDELEGQWEPEIVAEAEDTIRAYMESGFPIHTRPSTFSPTYGLDEFVRRVIGTRDIELTVDPPKLDMREVAERVREFTDRVAPLTGSSKGTRWIKRGARELAEFKEGMAPADALRCLMVALFPSPDYQKKRDFNDEAGWGVYRGQYDMKPGPRIAAPLLQWMGNRLVRAIPVIVAIYESVKDRHEVVDQIDLLLKLRNLLRDNVTIREEYRDRFDHILVDEFQDTDPLQAEIIFFLLDLDAKSEDWRKVRLRAGGLTLVGDPKQSIYRFRRADISMYALVCSILENAGAYRASLEANFRSRKGILDHVNSRFPELMSTSEKEKRTFDEASGRAFYEPIAPTVPGGEGTAVQLLCHSGAGNAETRRSQESEVLARCIRELVDDASEVRDEATAEVRKASYGDVAILVRATTEVPKICDALTKYGVPYTARGGRLFLENPLVCQFIFALRAISDPKDGPAQAAIRRPPFFPIDLSDVVAGRIKGDVKHPEAKQAADRANKVESVIRELALGRFEKPVAETAWKLMEDSAVVEGVRLGPNGEVRLALLREVVFELERLSLEEGLDYDSATARLRSWVDKPIPLDPPDLSGGRAVRIMTIFQAKGLEFPVVALWDAADRLRPPPKPAWVVDRLGSAWALRLNDIKVEWPEAGVIDRETRFEDEQYLRLLYVACTRARDLLILPFPADANAKMNPALSTLIRDARPEHVKSREPKDVDSAPVFETPEKPVNPEPISELVCKDRNRREYVTVLLEDEKGLQKDETGRFGKEFGRLVHQSLDLLLTGAGQSVEAVVKAVAESEHITEQVSVAVEDVKRALKALEKKGLRDDKVETEYPVVQRRASGVILVGVLDYFRLSEMEAVLLDFKTDAFRPKYEKQLKLYGELVRDLLPEGTTIKAGILLTETGEFHWLGS